MSSVPGRARFRSLVFGRHGVITSIDSETGNLVIGGKHVFPLGLSDPPPLGSKTPSGNDGLAEVASAGVTHVRNYVTWNKDTVDAQISQAIVQLNAASTHGLQIWMGLAGIAAGLTPTLDNVVNALKAHPGLGAWKGADEPAHSPKQNPVAACRAVYDRVQTLDPDHPVVLIEAPRGPAPTPNRNKGLRYHPKNRRCSTLRGRVRYTRHRHLSRLDSSWKARRNRSQHRYQCCRRYDETDLCGNAAGSDLDDPSDRFPGCSAHANH